MDIPQLHPDTIEEVKQRVDIVDVISAQVVLRKRGRDHVGLCPFHDEKTPSFSVSPQKQMYYCFGCGQGGNAIKFLMEIGKQSFGEVVFDLARRYQIPIKTLEPEQRQEIQRQISRREQLYEILAVTVSFYEHALRQPQGQIALTYLHRDRALSAETIAQFQLGYAPGGWETLHRHLVEQKHYPASLVEEAGLIRPRQSGSGYYDQFRDRLMIPILDAQGRAIGFGSRTLANEEPKYLNSPETPLFDKGKTLFALDKAKSAIQKQDQAIVVEGYFDAIALHAAGFPQAVAALGTAFSPEQLRLILRYCDSKQVIFNFDADKAGVKATQRAIAEIEPLVNSGQVQLRILNLPDGKDADEFLKVHADGRDRYRQLLDTAPLWFDWQIQQLLQDKDLTQADQFGQVAKQMVKLLNQLEDTNARSYYLSYCAERLAGGDSRLMPLHLNSLQSQLKKQKGKVRSAQVAPNPNASPVTADTRQGDVTSFALGNREKRLLTEAEALLLRIYLHFPEYRLEIGQVLEEKDLIFSLAAHRFLWQQITLVESALESREDADNQLFSVLQDHFLPYPEEFSAVLPLFHLTEKTHEDLYRSSLQIQAAIAVIERLNWEAYRYHCLQKWKRLDPVCDREQMAYYYSELRHAEQCIKALELAFRNADQLLLL